MNCPDCGTPMNHHASMIIDPRNEAEEARLDPELGGTVLQRHTCPDCGESVTVLGDPGGDAAGP